MMVHFKKEDVVIERENSFDDSNDQKIVEYTITGKRVVIHPNKIFVFFFFMLIASFSLMLFSTPSVSALTMIANCTDLQNMENNLAEDYELASDINCSDTITWNGGAGFEPIGQGSPYFSGSLNGSGYRIFGLYINETETNAGLIGRTASGALIYNLTLDTVTVITNASQAGSLLGESGGTTSIIDLFVLDVTVNGTGTALGGVIGFTGGTTTVTNATVIGGHVNGTGGSSAYTGGIIGRGDGTLLISDSMTNVTILGRSEVGGIAGRLGAGSSGGIVNSVSVGSTTATVNYVGGIVGYQLSGNINYSNATGLVTGGNNAGGLIGRCTVGKVYHSSASGNVSGGASVGGFCGSAESNVYVENNTASGNVTGTSTNVGGFVGYQNGGIINYSISNGFVFGTSGTGGFAGRCQDEIYHSRTWSEVSGTTNVGGFCGLTQLSALYAVNNTAYGNVSGSGSQIGGFIGYIDYAPAVIINASTFSEVVTGGSVVGGFVGRLNAGTLHNLSYTSGIVNGTNDVGGFVGALYDTIENCFATVNVTATGTDIGGFVGYMTSTSVINASYAANALVSGGTAGGFVGRLNAGTINNSYATSNVTATGQFVGGFVGRAEAASAIFNSYATGNVDGGAQNNIGGFAGSNQASGANITNCFSTGSASSVGSNVGGFAGQNVAGAILDGVYYNNHSGNPSACVIDQSGTATCTAIADDFSYFTGDVDSDAPMSFWDFVNVWIESSYGPPVLFWQGVQDFDAPLITLSAPANASFTASQTVAFNFTSTDTVALTLNCSVYLDGVLNATNSSVMNDTLTSISISGIASGTHNWSVTCTDGVGNSNSSETRIFTVDLAAPIISGIVYSPNSSAALDPNALVQFNVTITDADSSAHTVFVQYHNGTSWANLSMTNTSVTAYNASLTLQSVNTNYTFSIFANDSVGNANVSANQTFVSVWDCTWTVDSDLGQAVGFDETATVANMTVNNTGDANYSVNNCTLNFSITDSLASGRMGFNTDFSSSYAVTNLAAGSSSLVNVSVLFLDELLEEAVTITTTETSAISDNGSRPTSLVLLSSQAGPYLFQSVVASPSTVYLTSTNFTLNGSVRNLMGNGSVENTAYNVSFNWTVPASFTNSSGNLAVFFENLTNSSTQYNPVVFEFGDVASMSPGINTFSLYAQGYNGSGSFIANSDNETLLTESVNITFLCYDTSDGVCVTACGHTQDPDCEQEVVTVNAGGGGGGGGGGGDGPQLETSDAYFELLSGRVQKFYLPIENRFNVTKRDITVSVSGINARFIELTSALIPEIGPYSSENVTVIITAPAYFSAGEHLLTFKIQGEILTAAGKKQAFLETKIVTLRIVEISREDAASMLAELDSFIAAMNESGMVLDSVLQLRVAAHTHYEDFDFLGLKRQYEAFRVIYDAAFLSQELIERLHERIRQAERSGITVLETKKLLYLAESSFRRGDYVLSSEKLKEAELTFALETKGEFNILYVIKNNPLKSSFAVVSVVVLGYMGAFSFRYHSLVRRKRALDGEERLLLQLMQTVQRECFEHNKMSMEEYGEAMQQYERKFSDAIEEKINVGSQIDNLARFNGRKKALNDERERLINLVKKAQDDYLNHGTIEARIYKNMIHTYLKRLSEIEEQITFIEANEALRSKKFFSRVLRRFFS